MVCHIGYLLSFHTVYVLNFETLSSTKQVERSGTNGRAETALFVCFVLCGEDSSVQTEQGGIFTIAKKSKKNVFSEKHSFLNNLSKN